MRTNLHSVAMSIGVLGIQCNSCGHRAALERSEKLPIHQGNMTTLRSLKMTCTKCGAKDFEFYIPFTLDEVKLFLAGEPMLNRKVE